MAVMAPTTGVVTPDEKRRPTDGPSEGSGDSETGSDAIERALLPELCDTTTNVLPSPPRAARAGTGAVEESKDDDGAEESKDDLIRRLHEVILFQHEEILVLRTKKAAPSTSLPQNIEDCLKLPGIYVYHVGCLTVIFIDPSGRQEYIQEWCVVKVGRAAEGKSSKCINDRLGPECEDIKQWRGEPTAPRITAKSLKGNDGVGDLIMCLPGSTMVGVEEKVRQILGLPLGVGRIMPGQEEGVLLQMQARGPGGNHMYCGKYQNAEDKKITAKGWKMYLYLGDRSIEKGQNMGPSELIMMPKNAMEKLQRKFRENCSEFASQNNTYDDEDGGKGPAWNYIQEASKALPSDWHEKEVTVRFTTDGLIDPLTLKLWDPSKEVK